MALINRNDEQIQVGVTPGLVAGSSFFIFDGKDGKPDYRQFEIVPSELNGRGILAKYVDYDWDFNNGRFTLLLLGDRFVDGQFYNIHFQALNQPRVYDNCSLINSSFFIRDINLVNLSESRTLEKLNYFIDKYEPECLKRILGIPLYRSLVNESSQRITDLTYGSYYVAASGVQREWDGLVHGTNISLIANYVYYYFQKASALQTAGTATKSSKPEAATAESPIEKMVAAWQYFAEETRHMCSFLWNKRVDDLRDGARVYPEFTSDVYNDVMEFARRGAVNKFGF